jgi:phosphatidylglycerophosphatase C
LKAKSVKTPIAIFDLDGTLTTRDTFVAYLVSFGRRHRKGAALVSMPFRIAGYLLKMLRDDQLKEQLLQSFFFDVSRDVIQEHTDWFVQNWLPTKLHPIGQRFLKQHQAQGHRVVLLSASPDLYVPAIAKNLNIPECVCTQVEFQDERCIGKLIGDNCKGSRKLEAIKRHLGYDLAPDESYAYGDSKHDLPVLEWVAHGTLLRRSGAIDVKKRTS